MKTFKEWFDGIHITRKLGAAWLLLMWLVLTVVCWPFGLVVLFFVVFGAAILALAGAFEH